MRNIKQRHRETAPGQVLVIFALALVAIVAMVGLVIDGGATFVQRRDQQNVADQAAMAGAYAYVSASPNQSQAALAAARNIAAANGYTHDWICTWSPSRRLATSTINCCFWSHAPCFPRTLTNNFQNTF